MSEVQKIYCPSCGAPVRFLEGKEYTYCTSCGHQLFKEDIHFEKRMEYEDKQKNREFELEKKKQLDKSNYIYLAIMVLTVIIFSLLMKF